MEKQEKFICDGCGCPDETVTTYELYEGMEGNLQFVGIIALCKDCSDSSAMCLVPCSRFV